MNGMAHSMERATEAIDEALTKAKVKAEEAICIHAGMTGADFPYEYELLKEALIASTGIRNVKIENDCMIAYRGGTSSSIGAVLCIGTGTNAAVIRPDAEPFIYGYYVREEDSGGESLGNLALRAVLDSDVGLGPETSLKALILAHYGVGNSDELMLSWIQGKLSSRKSIVPIAFEAAAEGDEVAIELIRAFGIRNAKYIRAGIRRFDIADCDMEVVLSGSLFKARNPLLRETVETELRRYFPAIRIVNAVYEPVVGAVLMALDRIHGQPYPFDGQLIMKSAREMGLMRF
jgi:Predicted N-acetylglucosamine kinase